jgi:two-component system OmpR family sensor kinase
MTTDTRPHLETLETEPPPRGRRYSWSAGTERIRSRWDDVSLRGRLVAIMLVALIGALALTGAAASLVLTRYLVGQVDEDLSLTAVKPIIREAQNWDEDTYSPPSKYVVVFSLQADNPLSNNPQVKDDDGLVPDWPGMTTASARAHPTGQKFTVLSDDGTMRWRVVAVPATFQNVATGDSSTGYAMVALPLDQADDALRRIETLFFLFGAGFAALMAVLGTAAIRRAFVPLTEVEDTAAAIAAGDLSRRIPEHPTSTEVGRLTSALNGMLAQIESAFRSREASEARTRRFAADASHELRTPLASIRGFAELYRQGAVREPEDVARTMGRIEDEARRMGLLVEDLLVLARLDEQRPAREEPVDLAVLAGDAGHDARGLAPDRTVRLVGLATGQGPQSATVIGDDGRLRQVVANLVANAVRHTPAGTPIEIAVGTEGPTAVLEVRDHGPGLPPEHAAKVFERFYRVDSSRARGQGGGSGLGLSIVAAVVTAHGGRVGVAPTPGGGATFRVELPAAPHQQDDGDDDVQDVTPDAL